MSPDGRHTWLGALMLEHWKPPRSIGEQSLSQQQYISHFSTKRSQEQSPSPANSSERLAAMMVSVDAESGITAVGVPIGSMLGAG